MHFLLFDCIDVVKGGETMERNERTSTNTMAHQLILQDRNRLELTGVTSVIGFDETTVSCVTDLGSLSVEGSDLRVQRLDVDGTMVSVVGQINSLTYTDVRKGGLLGRLFR